MEFALTLNFIILTYSPAEQLNQAKENVSKTLNSVFCYDLCARITSNFLLVTPSCWRRHFKNPHMVSELGLPGGGVLPYQSGGVCHQSPMEREREKSRNLGSPRENY